MKALFIGLFLFGTSWSIQNAALAENTSTRGFLSHVEGGRNDGAIYYQGFADGGAYTAFDVKFALNVSHELTQSQFETMLECTNKKATHAILLMINEKEVEGASDISEVTQAKCIASPGYLDFWKTKMVKLMTGQQ